MWIQTEVRRPVFSQSTQTTTTTPIISSKLQSQTSNR